MNFHYSVSLDLFGSETSTNVANYYTSGLKGRWSEERRRDDHRLTDDAIMVDAVTDDGEIGADRGRPRWSGSTPTCAASTSPTARTASTGGTRSWSRPGCRSGCCLPHSAFNRKVGAFAGIEATPAGEMLSADEWARRKGAWLPTDVDKTHVRSLMRPVHERGKIAAWIAPPRQGINGKPFDYEYVHLS